MSHLAPAVDKMAQIKRVLADITARPGDVLDWRVEAGSDWSGDRAVWVYFKLKREDVGVEETQALRQEIGDLIRDIERDPELLVYVYFRGPQDSLDP